MWRVGTLLRWFYSFFLPLQTLNTGRANYTAYSAASTYAVGDKVFFNGNNYINITAITTPEAFDPTKWKAVGVKLNIVENFGARNVAFYPFTQFIKKFLRFNSQTIYLEKYLNDEYSTGAAYPYSANNGIYIDNSASQIVYLYNKIESLASVYAYNKWRSTITFASGEYCVYARSVWKSLQNGNLNKPPDSEPTWWVVQDINRKYLFNKSESTSTYDFIIYVPASVVYTEARMRSQVDQYKAAGRQYAIITY